MNSTVNHLLLSNFSQTHKLAMLPSEALLCDDIIIYSNKHLPSVEFELWVVNSMYSLLRNFGMC